MNRRALYVRHTTASRCQKKIVSPDTFQLS
jgi:hypothetical protein